VIESQGHVEIGATPEAVFDYLADMSNEPKWLPGASEVHATSDGTQGAVQTRGADDGTRHRQAVPVQLGEAARHPRDLTTQPKRQDAKNHGLAYAQAPPYVGTRTSDSDRSSRESRDAPVVPDNPSRVDARASRTASPPPARARVLRNARRSIGVMPGPSPRAAGSLLASLTPWPMPTTSGQSCRRCRAPSR
jgi:hypothetical protein